MFRYWNWISASPRTNSEVENALSAYVPTKEEEAFAKRVYNSPRRISEQNDVSFNVDKFQMEQPGPSSLLNNSIGELIITLLSKF